MKTKAKPRKQAKQCPCGRKERHGPGVQMWRMKLFLLPVGAVAELMALAICWTLAIMGALRTSERIMNCATRTFPNLDWYFTPRRNRK